MTKNGDQPIAGPMLVLQGESDRSVKAAVTDQAVEGICAAHPESKLQYLTYPGVEHVPVMYAAQRTWLDWIADRFAGTEVEDGCVQERVPSARDYGEYQVEVNWFIEYATQAYQLANLLLLLSPLATAERRSSRLLQWRKLLQYV
ncbi:MAG: hypothetical protein Q9174_006682 [Haloplaca sp. 1 TL-2023]